MTNGITKAIVSRPGHFWPITLISLLWNGFGGFDFLMKGSRMPSYVDALPVETIFYLDTMPYWVMAFWAVGVWSALLGSLLLVVRSRFAVPAFLASLAGLAVTTVWSATNAFHSGQPSSLTATIWAVALGLFAYTWSARRRGLLR